MRHRSLAPLAILALSGCGPSDTGLVERDLEPIAVINSPDDGYVTNDAVSVELVGTIADGNGIDTIQEVLWTSQIDGDLGEASLDDQGTTRVSTMLTAGIHTITLTAIDAKGLEASDSISVTVQAEQVVPNVVISAPQDNASLVSDTPIDLYATVSDNQQSPESLVAVWSYTPANGGARTLITSGAPDAQGISAGAWTDPPNGAWLVRLEVTDSDDHVGYDEVAVVVSSPDEVDQDGDGFLGADDCDDFDSDVHPDADEACNDVDDDCSGEIDDKDLDGDGHVDQGCTSYAGLLPLDDCNDNNGAVYLGAIEQLDGADNNCDGLIDEGTAVHDDDGDCYCESLTLCVDSSEPSCVVLDIGDCDDTDPALDPGDGDLDGYSSCDGDCDDTDNTLNLNDFDGDGFSTCDGDCSDFDPTLTPATCP